MFLVFLRHGSVAALLAGVAVAGLAFCFGWIEPRPALILLGALLFYLSEYGMHRFAFHAPPLSGRRRASCNTASITTTMSSPAGSICCFCRSGFWRPISPSPPP